MTWYFTYHRMYLNSIQCQYQYIEGAMRPLSWMYVRKCLKRVNVQFVRFHSSYRRQCVRSPMECALSVQIAYHSTMFRSQCHFSLFLFLLFVLPVLTFCIFISSFLLVSAVVVFPGLCSFPLPIHTLYRFHIRCVVHGTFFFISR